MTIAIGFITRPKKERLTSGQLPSIWMASDSQTSYGATKRENPNKINIIKCYNGGILIAQADSVELGDRLIEKLQRKAKDIKLVNFESGINAVKSALLEVRNELLEWNKGCNIDLEKFFWTEHRLNLLVAYYFDEKPYLYKMDIYRGMPTAVKSFEAIGGGESLGYFLLNENVKADPDFENGIAIAISVVEKVIDNVDGCGRPTWVGYVGPLPVPVQERDKLNWQCAASIMREQDVELVTNELKTSDNRWASMQKAHIVKVMKRVSQKFQRKFIKQQTHPDRFVRMRFGEATLEALKIATKHIAQSSNKDARQLMKDFREELGKVNNKPALKSIWERICEAVPSVAQIPKANAEISKLF